MLLRILKINLLPRAPRTFCLILCAVFVLIMGDRGLCQSPFLMRPELRGLYKREGSERVKPQSISQDELIQGAYFEEQFKYHENTFPTKPYLETLKDGLTSFHCLQDNPECLFKNTFEDGTVKLEGRFFNQKLDGTYREYYPNSRLKKEITFKKGRRDGLSREYFENGSLRTEKNYVRGILHGPYKAYYSSGELKLEGAFKKGKFNGEAKIFNRDHQLLLKDTFKKGVLVDRTSNWTRSEP